MGSFITLKLTALVISLIICAVFAFLETCITALRPYKIRELSGAMPKYSAILKVLEHHPQHLIILTLIVSSLVNSVSAALITDLIELLFKSFMWSAKLGFAIGIFIATAAILIFGEIIPKNIAKTHGEYYISGALGIIHQSYYLLLPFIQALDQLSKYVMRKINKNNPILKLDSSEKEIKYLIQHIEEHGLLERDKTAMLQNIFRLSRTSVREIMVPDTEIIALDSESSVAEALEIFSQYHFSRIPIFHQKATNIIGILYQKDLLAIINTEQYKQLPIKRFIRPILFTPESLKVSQLLREFKQQHGHMAIVLNEYGSMTGLVTLEDALEEIVGEIADEHEAVHHKIVPLPTGGWLVDASISIESLSTMLKVEFPSEGSATLGGFLTERLQHLPKKDDLLEYHNYKFKIAEANLRKVIKVQILTPNHAPISASINITPELANAVIPTKQQSTAEH
ncbi:MAG TPA: hemolysin family protein [Candidatus Babeliales bacterium]|nr:hemolysin family protein [Candidatus Babeliales bacterium]